MAEYTIDLPPGYGVPTIDLATDLLPTPTMDAIAASPQVAAKIGSVVTPAVAAEATRAEAAYAKLPVTPVRRHPLTGWFHVVGADPTGTTNSSAAIQAAIDAARDYGRGTVYLPAGTYLAEITIRHRVSLRGDGKRQTVIKAVPGSSAPGVIQFPVGYAQDTWFVDLEVLGNGNAGQCGFYIDAQPIAPNNNGGWWEGGMRRVQISGFGSGDCIHFTHGATGDIPHQFLNFYSVYAYAGTAGRAIYSDGQTGQMTFYGCQFDGAGAGTPTGTTANVDITGGYSWTFVGTTFQDNLMALKAAAVQQVTVEGCYFENIGKALTASAVDEIATTMVVINPHFASAGYVSAGDNTGYLASATGQSFIEIIGGGVTGSIQSPHFRTDSQGIINPVNVKFQDGNISRSSGFSKQLAVSGAGQISPPRGAKTVFVNSSATAITTINAARGLIAGDEINLLAFGGTIVLSSANADGNTNIALGSRTSPMTVPQNGIVTLLRMDSVVGWVVKSVSY